jgi:hypothetical protein
MRGWVAAVIQLFSLIVNGPVWHAPCWPILCAASRRMRRVIDCKSGPTIRSLGCINLAV